MKEIYEFVKKQLGHDSSGHSVDHATRVYQMAKKLQQQEGGDALIIETAALVHDVIDPKIFEDIDAQKQKLRDELEALNYTPQQIHHIFEIIESISFSGGIKKELSSLEAKIVQDADRLDAIGAIGIGRTFMYGGAKGNPMYDSTLPIQTFESEAEYRNHKGTVIHHFYEKLFKLRDLMNTKSARQIATKRHEFMEAFVSQFLEEWEDNI